MSVGKLFMFDGPDGVGKTTQFRLVAEQLKKEGYDVFATHMLGGTEIGEALRAVMFSDIPRPAITNFYLSLAIYYALVETVASERQAGKVVLIDRSPLSLVAYQVYGDGFDERQGLAACRAALEAFQPDALILYQAPLAVLASRRQTQRQHKQSDYFEKQQLAYHERTALGYQKASEQFAVRQINAAETIAAVHEQTMQVVRAVLAAE